MWSKGRIFLDPLNPIDKFEASLFKFKDFSSDMFGRKAMTPPLLVSMSLIGLASAYMPTFTTFVAMRSICAMVFIGWQLVFLSPYYA